VDFFNIKTLKMINKVTLIGNVGNDPETRTLDNGTVVGRFSLATSDSYKDKDGEWQKQTEWHNVVVWRELAERARSYVKKGMLVYIEGKVTTRKYTDKEGVDRYATDIVANTLRALEKMETTTDATSRNFPQSDQVQAAPAPPPTRQAPTDDLPF
jgi:single-strand DNA-binding protein